MGDAVGEFVSARFGNVTLPKCCLRMLELHGQGRREASASRGGGKIKGSGENVESRGRVSGVWYGSLKLKLFR